MGSSAFIYHDFLGEAGSMWKTNEWYVLFGALTLKTSTKSFHYILASRLL